MKSLVKPYRRTEIILKHLLNSVGYTYYQIYRAPEKRKNYLAHRLVMQAFEPNEDKDNLQVNHKDLDIQNNKLSNLEWCTHQENIDHYIASDKHKARMYEGCESLTGGNHHLSSLTDEIVIELRKRWEPVKGVWGARTKLAREFGIPESTTRLITDGKTWKHLL